ncbi:MAG: helix-turn-helix domain-containing protein [Lentisphaerota bacterium]
MEVPISSKTIELLRGFSTSLVSAGIVQQEELNNLWAIAKKSQEVRPAEPLILITRAKSAAILGISQRNLDRLIRGGDISCVKIGKRSIRLDQKEIGKYIEKNTGCNLIPVTGEAK